MDDDTLDGGGGEPHGGSSEEEQGKPPGNGEWIPKARFDEAIGSLKDQIRELKESTARPAPKDPELPKRYTRSQLKAAVEAQQISQDQADEIWDTQVLESAQATAAATVTQAERERLVNGDIAQYKRLIPGVAEAGSDDRNKVGAEYTYLVNTLGYPKTKETELAALRAVYGPLDRLEKSRGRPAADHHRESGGGGGQERPGNQGSGKLVDTLTEREKSHYQKGIDQGRYKDWNAVEDELKYAKPGTRRKHGALV